jgi:hypothetical protein
MAGLVDIRQGRMTQEVEQAKVSVTTIAQLLTPTLLAYIIRLRRCLVGLKFITNLHHSYEGYVLHCSRLRTLVFWKKFTNTFCSGLAKAFMKSWN